MVDACAAALSLAGRAHVAAARARAGLASSRHAAADAARRRPTASDPQCGAVSERADGRAGGAEDVYGGPTASGAAATRHGGAALPLPPPWP